MWKELVVTLVLYANGGIVLPLFIGVYIEAKKIIKQISSSTKI